MELDRPQNNRPPCVCYRPAVFFCHIRLVALSLQGAFQKCHFLQFSLFKKIA
jgi:hypothetical protein